MNSQLKIAIDKIPKKIPTVRNISPNTPSEKDPIVILRLRSGSTISRPPPKLSRPKLVKSASAKF